MELSVSRTRNTEEDTDVKARILVTVICLSVLVSACIAQDVIYQPTWESINSRPTPAWFADAKFGIFIHWGAYSVPAWGPKGKYAEWYWQQMQDKNGPTWKFHVKTYGEDFKYQDFAPLFKAEMFDPEAWADVFKRSGARYIVLTSKHHEGFCLWPNTQSWNWNSVDIGPHRDLAGDLIKAVHAAGLRMGFYYSLYEWFNPLYREDVNRYVAEHMLPQIKDLVTRYKPDIVWSDGEWDHSSETWRSTEFLAWLFNESPAPKDVVVNDRWGKETRGKNGGFFTTEYGQIHWGQTPDEKFLQRCWEECRGMGASFGYNRNEDISDYKEASELIRLLIEVISKGGNLLLDIGPTADGRIPVIMQERLLQIGDWLKVNGEAVYGTRAWRKTADSQLVRFTCRGDAVYAICLGWPGSELVLNEPKASENTLVTMLGFDKPLKWREVAGKIHIEVPAFSPESIPCGHAYVFKLTGVK
jgi:alpha-L-fucosidase